MPNLVGIGNSQVPTNAMLGGLAYQDPAHANLTEVEIENIAAIKANASELSNVLKIFVYNTRNDSDGGAWRHRTQNTSWYNEGVSKIRGARKEFPSVAILVVTNNELTIYDGDDPTCPMWMIFPTNTAAYSLIGGNHDHDLRSVAGLNGKIVVCNVPGGWNHGSMVQVDFIKDDAFSTWHSGNKRWVVGIQKRGEYSDGYYIPITDGNYLTDNSNQDLAMGVVSNARVDPDTGLPVPTIALVSQGGNSGNQGISVVRDDGAVFYLRATLNGYKDPRELEISGDYLYVLTDPRILYRFPLPLNANFSTSTFSSGAYDATDWLDQMQGYTNDADDCHLAVSNKNEGNIAVGTPTELIIIRPDESASNPLEEAPNRSIAVIGKDYNSGWLMGDIRCSALTSTDSTDLTATNITSNWATASNWTYQSQRITLASDGAGGITMTHSDGSGSYVYAYLPFTVEANTDYVIQMDFSFYNSSDIHIVPTAYNAGNQRINLNAVPGFSKGGQFNSSSNTTLYLQINHNSTSATTIKSIICQKIDNSERDRTKSNQSFLTYGTINKEPVNTGCELMSYSPANTSSYLEAPISTSSIGLDMNFSDAFYMNYWANPIGKMAIEDFSTGAYNNMVLLMTSDASGVYLRSKAGPSSGGITVTNGGWNMFTAVHDGGTSLKIYKNGHLIQTYTTSAVSNQNARVIIFGNSYNNNGGSVAGRNYSVTADSKMALARVGQTNLSQKMILKMYYDELSLFTPNAKCSLYGTSSAITAVAYDNVNNNLHVGTSSGRSEFVGLTRINNTTTAVARTIAASDGLVAEE